MTPLPSSPQLHLTDADVLREQILAYFHAVSDRYEQLFVLLTDERAYYQKSIPLRHPLIFYLGHTAVFFVNKLVLAGLLTQRINPQFESLFAVGVDEMSWDTVHPDNYSWPSIEAVKDYRTQVRSAVDQLIRTYPLTTPIDWQHSWWPILMGIEHECIHLETSSVLIRQQQLAYLTSDPAWPICRLNPEAPINELLPVAAGQVQLGRSQQPDYYAWDNELGKHIVEVSEFKASRYLVSNAEFMPFVLAGGYEQDQFWQPEGLAWKTYCRAQHPSFWIHKHNQWWLRLMTDEIPLPLSWPVEVNYHEAKAFCAWQSQQLGVDIRLPTEDEWQRLFDHALGKDLPALPAKANHQLNQFASPCPVSLFAQGDFYDVVGNVWQWTETPIYPFNGFDVHSLYDDFSTPTFDGQHNLIKGGSWIACGNEALSGSRYAFRRHFFQHAGFRYVNSSTALPTPAALNSTGGFYETDQQLSEYAEFHYGDSYYGVANFPQQLAQIAKTLMANKPRYSALDLGCATGRATFELAREFDQVVGVDFSARFIRLALELRDQGYTRYTLAEEGELFSYKTRQLADFGLVNVADKVHFLQGDACNLKPELTNFDFILAANLIDRLYQPAIFLTEIINRLKIGGVLMLTSPYTWREEHTQREHWLGGFKKDGENYTTLDALKAHLSPQMRLMQPPQDVPFVIRETRRKYQHSLAEVSCWERVS